MSKHRFVLLAIAPVLMLFAAGCGGGSDSSSASEITASSIGKAEFVEKADAQCRKGREEVRSQFGSYLREYPVEEGKESKAEVESKARAIVESIVIPSLQKVLDEIRALGAPKGETAKVEAILEAMEKGMERAEGDPERAIQESEQMFAGAKKLAVEYGLKVCGLP